MGCCKETIFYLLVIYDGTSKNYCQGERRECSRKESPDLGGVHIQSCHKSYINKINPVIVILEKFVTFLFFCM